MSVRYSGTEVVRLHRDEKLKVAEIAARLGITVPAVYRAFRRQGYFLATMKEPNLPRARKPADLLPPDPLPSQRPGTPGAKAIAEQERMALPRVERDPCGRCGARGDYGCGCRRASVGWCVG